MTTLHDLLQAKLDALSVLCHRLGELNDPSVIGRSFTLEQALEQGWISQEEYNLWSELDNAIQQALGKSSESASGVNTSSQAQLETGQMEPVAFFRNVGEKGADLTSLQAKLLKQLSDRLARGEIDSELYTDLRQHIEETFKKATGKGGDLVQ